MDKNDAIKIAALIKELAARTNVHVQANIGTYNMIEAQNPALGVPLKELMQVTAAQTHVIVQLGDLLFDDALAGGLGDDVERFLRENDGTV